MEKEQEKEVLGLYQKIEKQFISLEKRLGAMNIAEYVSLINSPRKILWLNFIIGIARGLGIAIGATLLGAIVLMLLFRLAELNLPIIGEFIARMVIIVKEYL